MMRSPAWKHCSILAALTFSGAAALIYEVVASQTLLYFFNASTYSVATVLSSFLFGLAAGSIAMSTLLSRIPHKQLAFALMEFLIGSSILLLLRFDALPLSLVSSSLTGHALLLAKFAVAFTYLLLPTLLLGALFPLASSLIITTKRTAGTAVGLLYGFDTLGAMIGALAAGFLLIPLLGLEESLLLGSALSFAAGLLIIPKRWKVVLAYIAACIAVFASFASAFSASSPTMLTASTSIRLNTSTVLFSQPSAYGDVTVVNDSGTLTLYTGRRAHCSNTALSDERIADIIGHLNGNATVLHIGLGCGLTLKGILQHPVQRVDVVEINPAIVQAARRYYADTNSHALDDPRVTLFVEDGAQFLRRSNATYDAIIVTAQHPDDAHSSPLYTAEYFQLASRLLPAHGIFATYSLIDYQKNKLLYFTLHEAFPFVYFREHDAFSIVGAKRSYDFNLSGQDYALLDRLRQEPDYEINTLNNPILSTLP